MTPAQSTLVHFRNRVFLKGGTKRAKATPPSLCFDSEKQGRKLLRVDWWTYLYTLRERERESIGEVLGNHLGRATSAWLREHDALANALEGQGCPTCG